MFRFAHWHKSSSIREQSIDDKDARGIVPSRSRPRAHLSVVRLFTVSSSVATSVQRLSRGVHRHDVKTWSPNQARSVIPTVGNVSQVPPAYRCTSNPSSAVPCGQCHKGSPDVCTRCQDVVTNTSTSRWYEWVTDQKQRQIQLLVSTVGNAEQLDVKSRS